MLPLVVIWLSPLRVTRDRKVFYGSSQEKEGGSVSPFFSFLRCIVFRVSLQILMAWSLCLPRICALVPGCAPTSPSSWYGPLLCVQRPGVFCALPDSARAAFLFCGETQLQRLLQRKCWITIEHGSEERSSVSADHFLLPGTFCKDAASAP